ncbi:unnamed protein product [Cuscuta campestris]|uniref:Uncharacterized protein n=1 Tax=Cuscuta campestris TaxID=132261 RepID=A0A484MUD5_9ASTE|nr:unnamed protein product [Cuscuta campestris]
MTIIVGEVGWGASVSDRRQGWGGRGGRQTDLAFYGTIAGIPAAWGLTAGRGNSGLGVAGGSFGSRKWSGEVGMHRERKPATSLKISSYKLRPLAFISQYTSTGLS